MFVLLLLLVGDRLFDPSYQRVDLIELNHKYGENGQHVFDQVIFWERHPGSGKYRVLDWRMVEDAIYFSRRPKLDQSGSMYAVTWSEGGDYFDVRSRIFRESWTQTDPEVLDKKVWPDSCRAKLQTKYGRQKAQETLDKDEENQDR